LSANRQREQETAAESTWEGDARGFTAGHSLFWTGKKKIKRVCSGAKFDESVHYQLQVRIVKNRSYKPNN